MLINKDPIKKYNVDLKIFDRNKAIESPFNFSTIVCQYSPAQYKWKEDGIKGHPIVDLPPKKINSGTLLEIPAYSITIIKQVKAPIEFSE